MNGARNFNRPHQIEVKPTDVILLRLRDSVSGIPHLLRVGVVSRCNGSRVYYRHPTTSQEEWTLKEKVLHVFKDVEEGEHARRVLTQLAVAHTTRLSALNDETQTALEALVSNPAKPRRKNP